VENRRKAFFETLCDDIWAIMEGFGFLRDVRLLCTQCVVLVSACSLQVPPCSAVHRGYTALHAENCCACVV
jgi:hypothetical protein